jgi:hypothetical protein
MVTQQYGGYNYEPGIQASYEATENSFLWGKWENQYIAGLSIDGTSEDSGNTGYTSILRKGLLMGRVAASKMLKPWDPTATTGEQHIYGILGMEVNVHNAAGANTNRLTGMIYVAGGVDPAKLYVPGTTAIGLSSSAAYEVLAKELLRGRFVLKDDFYLSQDVWTQRDITGAEQSGGLTITAADHKTAFHNTGGTVTITLPATAVQGLAYEFYAPTSTTDEITVSSGSANIRVPGSAAANSLSVDGAYRRIVGDGTQWVVQSFS